MQVRDKKCPDWYYLGKCQSGLIEFRELGKLANGAAQWGLGKGQSRKMLCVLLYGITLHTILYFFYKFSMDDCGNAQSGQNWEK